MHEVELDRIVSQDILTNRYLRIAGGAGFHGTNAGAEGFRA